MFSTVKDYAQSMQNKVSETYTSYRGDKIDQMLIEATSNDQWELSNQKLLELSDETFGSNGNKIIDHLIQKLKLTPSFEWKRIIKTMNVIDFLLKNGNLNVLGKIQMNGQQRLQELQTFSFEEGNIDRGRQIRDKAYLIMDLIHNQHKLEIERKAALEYRQKFYPGGSSGFTGAGVSSVSNQSISNQQYSGYSAPASLSYNSQAPISYGGSEPSSSIIQTKPPVWGADTIISSNLGGATFNITNNNNINNNYGSSITAISSDNTSVPTFHDLDKQKKAQKQKDSTFGMIGQALGNVVSSEVIASATSTVQSSKYLAKASDTIKRNTGLDLHKAIGGKTAADIAEQRLKKEQESNQKYGSYASGYQSISIPNLEEPKNQERNQQPHKLNQYKWKKEEQTTNQNDLFKGLNSNKKRMDDDSDENNENQNVQAKQEINLLDLGNDSEPAKNDTVLLDIQQSQQTNFLLDIKPEQKQEPVQNLFSNLNIQENQNKNLDLFDILSSQSSTNTAQPTQSSGFNFLQSENNVFQQNTQNQINAFQFMNQQQNQQNQNSFMNAQTQNQQPAFSFMSSSNQTSANQNNSNQFIGQNSIGSTNQFQCNLQQQNQQMNLFGSLSIKDNKSQPIITQTSNKIQSTEPNLQDSNKKKDAWSMGAKLINF